jgi:predicted RNase H-like HicB family nuclease
LIEVFVVCFHFRPWPHLPADFEQHHETGRRPVLITFRVETEQETDGRWLAEVVELPGVLAHGSRQEEAVSRVQALALRVVAERLEHGETGPELLSISFKAA